MEEKIEEKKINNRKKLMIITLLCVVAGLLVGISYAFWQSTKVQEQTNIIASGCFDVSLEGKNPINLSSAYPISEEEGMGTTPYTFTITNTCSGVASYVVNLESLSNTTFQNSSIRVALDNSNKLYSEYDETSKFFSDSKEARTLASGTLEGSGSVTYNLRMWIDETTSNTEQNKIFESKVIVTSGLSGEKTDSETKTLSDKVEIGEYISVTPTNMNYTISKDLTGYTSDQTINPSELNVWRVIRKNDDGTVDVVSENVSSTKVYFSGPTGYMNLISGLNTIAAQYADEKYVQNTRYIGFNSQIETCTSLDDCPEDTSYEIDTNLIEAAMQTLKATTPEGTEISYWIASRRMYDRDTDTVYSGRYITSDGMLGANQITDSAQGENPCSFSIRPILTLKADLELSDGKDGSADTPYSFK